MSLVNDMLRDLDQRGAPAPKEAEELLVISEERETSKSKWLFATLSLVLITGVVVGKFVSLEDYFPSNSPNTLEASVDTDVTADTVAENKTDTTELTTNQTQILASENSHLSEAAVKPQTVKSESIVEAVAEVELVELEAVEPDIIETNPQNTSETAQAERGSLARRVVSLLSLAELAVKKQHLSLPVRDSALSYYREVLEFVPEHPQARLGLRNVAKTYLEIAQRYSEKKQFKNALGFLAKAEKVDAAYPGITALKSSWLLELEKLKSRQEPGEKLPLNNVASKDSAKPLDEKISSGNITVRARPSSIADKDAQNVDKTHQLMSKGRIGEALRTLKSFVLSHEQVPESAALLFASYLQQNDLRSAYELTRQVSWLPEVTKLEWLARLAMKNKQKLEARRLLETLHPDINVKPDYYGLLAGIYQQLGEYQLAADLYNQLVQVKAQRVNYWLGLSVAEDALQNKAQALQAFLKTAALPGLAPKVQQYVRQRITALSQSEG